jgi:hypothetical protein
MWSCRLVILVDAVISGTVPAEKWNVGPHLIDYISQDGSPVVTDASARATNFPSTLGPFLHGHDPLHLLNGFSTRYHSRIGSIPIDMRLVPGYTPATEKGSLVYERAELLRSTAGDENGNLAIMAVHTKILASSIDEGIRLVNTLTRSRAAGGGDMRRGAASISILEQANLLDDSVMITDVLLGTDSDGIAYSMVYFESAVPKAIEGPVAPPVSQITDENLETGSDKLDFLDLQLYSAASAQSPLKTHATASRMRVALKDTIRLSKSWSALVLGHGAAFQVHTSQDDEYRTYMYTYFCTLYVDALMLSRIQDLLVRFYERGLNATLGLSRTDSEIDRISQRVSELDVSLAINGARYLIHGVVAHTGKSIRILSAYRDAVSLSSRLLFVENQIDNLSRLANNERLAKETSTKALKAKTDSRIEQLLAMIAVVAIPVTLTSEVYTYFQAPVSPLLTACFISTIAALLIVIGAAVRRQRRKP